MCSPLDYWTFVAMHAVLCVLAITALYVEERGRRRADPDVYWPHLATRVDRAAQQTTLGFFGMRANLTYRRGEVWKNVYLAVFAAFAALYVGAVQSLGCIEDARLLLSLADVAVIAWVCLGSGWFQDALTRWWQRVGVTKR